MTTGPRRPATTTGSGPGRRRERRRRGARAHLGDGAPRRGSVPPRGARWAARCARSPPGAVARHGHDPAVDGDLGAPPGCRGSTGLRSGPSTPQARAITRTASNASAARPAPGTPGSAAVPAGPVEHRADVHRRAAERAGAAISSSVGLRWSESAAPRRYASVGLHDLRDREQRDIDKPRDTLRDNASAMQAGAWWRDGRSASSGLSTAVVMRRGSSAGGRSHWSNTPARQGTASAALDVADERQGLSDRARRFWMAVEPAARGCGGQHRRNLCRGFQSQRTSLDEVGGLHEVGPPTGRVTTRIASRHRPRRPARRSGQPVDRRPGAWTRRPTGRAGRRIAPRPVTSRRARIAAPVGQPRFNGPAGDVGQQRGAAVNAATDIAGSTDRS